MKNINCWIRAGKCFLMVEFKDHVLDRINQRSKVSGQEFSDRFRSVVEKVPMLAFAMLNAQRISDDRNGNKNTSYVIKVEDWAFGDYRDNFYICLATFGGKTVVKTVVSDSYIRSVYGGKGEPVFFYEENQSLHTIDKDGKWLTTIANAKKRGE